VSFFYAGNTLSVLDARQLLSSDLLEALCARGIVEVNGGLACSSVRISPADGFLIAHDRSPPRSRDHINGVNAAARTLSSLTVRVPVDCALDLGTGCGYQALMASRHAARVIATDILPRALELTRFNAELNLITNIECRLGSFFEPVADEQFDLIVCNPPFIISPDSSFSFRDSGLIGDAVSEMILRDLPRHLNTDGYGAVLVNWELDGAEAWYEPGEKWIAESGCDALFLKFATPDPLSYAGSWNAQLRQNDPIGYAAALDRWVEYLSARGVASIAEAGVVLRRGRSSPWHLWLEANIPPSGDATDQMTRIFSAQDWLRSHSGSLSNTRFQLADGHTLHQTMTFTNGSYEVHKVAMRPAATVGVAVEFPPDLIAVLFSISRGSVYEIAKDVAEETGADLGAFLPRVESTIHDLLERGLLSPVEAPSSGATED
jgi:methylase of polypeptide subunit release factors